ncbi:MAG: hypothetical protein MZU97_19545 [Bacillus subtilis]|nr:hypothetical protein [Bacillus subtilis]
MMLEREVMDRKKAEFMTPVRRSGVHRRRLDLDSFWHVRRTAQHRRGARSTSRRSKKRSSFAKSR